MIFDTDNKKNIQQSRVQQQRTAATTQRAPINSSTLQPNDILQLQTSIGNQAVGEMLQRSTARQNTTPSVSRSPQPIIQRTPSQDGEKKRGFFSRLFGKKSTSKQPSWGEHVSPSKTGERENLLGNYWHGRKSSQDDRKLKNKAIGGVRWKKGTPSPTVARGDGSMTTPRSERTASKTPSNAPMDGFAPTQSTSQLSGFDFEQKIITPVRKPISPDLEKRVAEAFAKSTFYYGTQGGGSLIGKFLNNFAKKVTNPYWAGRRNRDKQQNTGPTTPHPWTMAGWQKKPPTRELNFYDPGPRVTKGIDHQMMDYYYGQNNEIHQRRDPDIGEYIHQMMGYKGEYNQNVSGILSWKNTYREAYSVEQQKAGNTEGWQGMKKPDPNDPNNMIDGNIFQLLTANNYAMSLTGTKEISRIVREGIAKYGGHLVFEGKSVSWGNVFTGGKFIADTAEEAIQLMPYFAADPGKSTVAFGKGKLTFHWGGKPTAPAQAHFRDNWFYIEKTLKDENNQDYKKKIFHEPENRLNLPHRFMKPDQAKTAADIYGEEETKMDNFHELRGGKPGTKNIFHQFPKLPVKQSPAPWKSNKKYSTNYNHKAGNSMSSEDILDRRKKGDFLVALVQQLAQKQQEEKSGTQV